MDYRSRSRRFCRWRPYRLTPAPRLDAPSCSRRCRKATHRAARKGRDAYRQESGGLPGRDGYPDGEAAPVLASPGSHRRQAEGALLSLADKAIEVMKAALAANDISVAEWIVERSVVRHSKPGGPEEKSARMRGEDARAELERKIAIISARLEEENASQAGPGAGEGEPLFLPSYSGGG